LSQLVAALLVLGLSLAGAQGVTQARTGRSCAPMPAVAAHRGGNEKAMENTVGSFTSAGEAGIRTWELDVRFDADGTPVVLHDATVDRVSPRAGPIARLDAGDHGIPTDDGQHIPALHEIYVLAQKYRAHVLTELKVMPTAAQWTVLAAEIDGTIGRSGVTLVSFEPAIVLQEREHFPGVATGLLRGPGYVGPQRIHRYGGSVLQSKGSITASRAATWHAAGLKVYAWTADKQADWARLSAWPVDVVITDKPFAYRQWADRQCRPAAAKK
jgi:glycerophosphoryl diester phosphodiesterase